MRSAEGCKWCILELLTVTNVWFAAKHLKQVKAQCNDTVGEDGQLDTVHVWGLRITCSRLDYRRQWYVLIPSVFASSYFYQTALQSETKCRRSGIPDILPHITCNYEQRKKNSNSSGMNKVYRNVLHQSSKCCFLVCCSNTWLSCFLWPYMTLLGVCPTAM